MSSVGGIHFFNHIASALRKRVRVLKSEFKRVIVEGGMPRTVVLLHLPYALSGEASSGIRPRHQQGVRNNSRVPAIDH